MGTYRQQENRPLPCDGNWPGYMPQVRSAEFFLPDSDFTFSPLEHFKIKNEPEVGFRDGDASFLLNLWNTVSVPLSLSAISGGIYMQQELFGKSEFSDCVPAVLDLVQGKVYRGSGYIDRPDVVLQYELSLLDRIWEELLLERKGKNKGKEGTTDYIPRPPAF